MNTVEFIEKNKIVVIVRGVDGENILPLAQAMYDGGIRLIEFTFDASGKIPHDVTAGYIKKVAEHFGDNMAVGAGTVLTKKQVELTREAGGKFIISPDTNEEVIKYTKEQGLVSIPGALTPTEIAAASRAGADFVKVFPVNNFGPKYIKDLLAPLSHVKMLAVGGITLDNIGEYQGSGAVGFGIGSGIVDKTAIANGEFDKITEYAKQYTSKI